MRRLDIAAGFVILAFLFKRLDLSLRQDDAVGSDLDLQGFQAGFEVRQVVPQPLSHSRDEPFPFQRAGKGTVPDHIVTNSNQVFWVSAAAVL
jgi:hypothetical protein